MLKIGGEFRCGERPGIYAAASQLLRARKQSLAGGIFAYIKNEITAFKKWSGQRALFSRAGKKSTTTIISGDFKRIRIFNLMQLIRKISRKFCSPYDEQAGGVYVLFPLHVLRESSTLTLGPDYVEIDVIRELSHRLPVGVMVAVKENPNMVGLRLNSEIKAVKELPNVVYISPAAKTSELIRQAIGVVGISGTALLEGAILRVPAFAVGSPEFANALSSSDRKNMH